MHTLVTKRFIILILSAVMLSSGHCRKDPNCTKTSHNALAIKNNSTRRINYAFYWNYPDTVIVDQYSPIKYGDKPLKTGDSVIRGAGPGGCWESVFLTKPKEWIYFFDQDSLEQLNWETIKATNRGVLERRAITLDDLIRNNFIISYP